MMILEKYLRRKYLTLMFYVQGFHVSHLAKLDIKRGLPMVETLRGEILEAELGYSFYLKILRADRLWITSISS